MTCAHVDFVEGGQQRGVMLGLDEPFGDRSAQAAHRNDFFLAVG